VDNEEGASSYSNWWCPLTTGYVDTGAFECPDALAGEILVTARLEALIKM
jgi:hypothetical protein